MSEPEPAPDPGLGSIGIWLRDFALLGAAIPPAMLCVLVLGTVAAGTLFAAGRPPPPLWETIVTVAPLCAAGTAAGLVVGAVLAPPVRWFAVFAWSRARLAAFAAGPVAGGLGSVVVLHAMFYAVDGRITPLKLDDLIKLIGLGAAVFGPPWVAYLAVQALRRSTIGVVVAAAIWMPVPTLVFTLAEQLRNP